MENSTNTDNSSTATRADRPIGLDRLTCPGWCTGEHLDAQVVPGLAERWHFGGDPGIRLSDPLGLRESEVVRVNLSARDTIDLATGTIHHEEPDAAILVGTENPLALLLSDSGELRRQAAQQLRAADLLDGLFDRDAAASRRELLERLVTDYGAACEDDGWLRGRHGDDEGDLPERLAEQAEERRMKVHDAFMALTAAIGATRPPVTGH
ncbi:MAG: hypothetical protein PGN11_05810 [Quadrisphaera sp.]